MKHRCCSCRNIAIARRWMRWFHGWSYLGNWNLFWRQSQIQNHLWNEIKCNEMKRNETQCNVTTRKVVIVKITCKKTTKPQPKDTYRSECSCELKGHSQMSCHANSNKKNIQSLKKQKITNLYKRGTGISPWNSLLVFQKFEFLFLLPQINIICRDFLFTKIRSLLIREDSCSRFWSSHCGIGAPYIIHSFPRKFNNTRIIMFAFHIFQVNIFLAASSGVRWS